MHPGIFNQKASSRGSSPLVMIALASLICAGAGLLSLADAAPASAPPALPLDATGDLRAYQPIHVKALDVVHDVATRDTAGDLMAFYYDQQAEWLLFRIGLFEALAPDGANRLQRQGVRVYVLADYAPGGGVGLPDGLPGAASCAWDSALRLEFDASGELVGDLVEGGGGVRRLLC